jgi:hypothetical protein
VFLLEVLNPWVIFVVVIFILQDYKKIGAFKPPLLLLEDFFVLPVDHINLGGGRMLRIYSKLRNLWWTAQSKHAREWPYFNAVETSIEENVCVLFEFKWWGWRPGTKDAVRTTQQWRCDEHKSYDCLSFHVQGTKLHAAVYKNYMELYSILVDMRSKS